MDVIREKAWLLEDQVKQLEGQTLNIRNRLRQKSIKRRLVIATIAIVTLGSIFFIVKPFDVDRN